MAPISPPCSSSFPHFYYESFRSSYTVLLAHGTEALLEMIWELWEACCCGVSCHASHFLLLWRAVSRCGLINRRSLKLLFVVTDLWIMELIIFQRLKCILGLRKIVILCVCCYKYSYWYFMPLLDDDSRELTGNREKRMGNHTKQRSAVPYILTSRQPACAVYCYNLGLVIIRRKYDLLNP